MMMMMMMMMMMRLVAAIGCVLFEERIGCFNDPPPDHAREFIENIVGFFKYQQPLMYKPPIYKIFPTKAWRVFEGYADRVTAGAQQFVNKVRGASVLSTGSENSYKVAERSPHVPLSIFLIPLCYLLRLCVLPLSPEPLPTPFLSSFPSLNEYKATT